ncbi:MAG: biotin transporter BioY [Halanaerobiales bacterium]
MSSRGNNKHRGNDITNVRNMNLIAIFTALTAIGAFIKIPLPHLAITLQTIFVLMAGIFLGKKMGAISQLLYVLLGLIGLPIFTQGGGPSYILKPSFGYLLGFVAAAYIVGYFLQNRTLNYINTGLASVLGTIVIYLIGVPYLYMIVNFISGAEMSISRALQVGLLVPLPGDIVKIVIITLTAPFINDRLKDYLNR